MSRTVITGRDISKAYRLGLAQSRMDFRETLMQMLRTPMKRLRKFNEDWSDGEDTFWALKDVNFDVNEGEVVGLHEVVLESHADRIYLCHDAKSRRGFAEGAVRAAEWLAGKKGFYDFKDIWRDL